MLKRILLALDQTQASASAQRHAIDLAISHGAAITGLVLVDPSIVSPPEPVPLGGDAFKHHKDSVLLQRAVESGGDIAKRFKADCDARKIECDARTAEGNALVELVRASALSDLIAIGVDTSFEAASACSVSETVTGLLRDNSRPVLVAPRIDQSQGKARTLIAYDGSIPAMRAVQLFCLTGINAEVQAVVATVDKELSVARTLSETAVSYLRERGYKAQAEPIAAGTDFAASLLDAAERMQASMIVAGAYGEQRWREWLMGSTTRRLLEQATVPLFIHH